MLKDKYTVYHKGHYITEFNETFRFKTVKYYTNHTNVYSLNNAPRIYAQVQGTCVLITKQIYITTQYDIQVAQSYLQFK